MRACWHPTETVVVKGVQMKQTVLIIAPRMTSEAPRLAYVTRNITDRTD